MKKLLRLLHTIHRLPVVSVMLDVASEEGRRMYRYYTRRHPRYFLIRNKTVGVAFIALKPFPGYEAFLATVSGKNSAAYYARRSERNGYRFRAIDPKLYIEQIHHIHTSAPVRQGKAMDTAYLEPLRTYPENANNTYYGLFRDEMLVGYLWCVRSGELITLNRLLGHAGYLKDGIMYQLVLSGIREIFGMKDRPAYIMYDTLFGASEGLGLFKKRLGFKPYKVNWKEGGNA